MPQIEPSLLVARMLRRRGARQPEQQRRQLDQAAAADDGVDPAGRRSRGRASSSGMRRGAAGRVTAPRDQSSTMARTSSSSWATASGSTSTRTCWAAGIVASAAPRSRACPPPGCRARPRTAGRRRRPRAPGSTPSAPAAARNASACGFVHGDLAGVDVGVDQVEHPVALEHAAVVLARPDRVRQHADPDARARAAPPTAGRTCASVKVCGSQNRRYAASAASCARRAGSSPDLASRSSRWRAALPGARPRCHAVVLAGEDPGGQLGRLAPRRSCDRPGEDASTARPGRRCARASACRPSRR